MGDGLTVAVERWPIAGGFTIARGTKTEAVVVVATVSRNGFTGRGECVPYARYGETVEGVVQVLRAQSQTIASGAERADLLLSLPAGAARNALDCALWSLAAQVAGQPVWALAGLARPQPATTAFTLSLGEPAAMAAAARAAAGRPLLKVKLGGAGDVERILAVREAAPEATLIVDANESWTEATLSANLSACARARVALIEQPLPAAADAPLEGLDSPVPLCADESFHGLDGLETVARRYRYANLKLDKTGGLTAAIAVAQAVREHGMGLMVGCMLGTSLGMAPAFLLTPWAEYVDLDGPLLLASDRTPGFEFKGSRMQPAGPGVWD
jgi:L-alanine-DL-glutamate epimerase-like enolase superfamily enzyme